MPKARVSAVAVKRSRKRYVQPMLKKLVLWAIAIAVPLWPAMSLAQGATVAGRTVDSTSRAPLPLVTVVLVNAVSGDTLSGTLTGVEGRFLLRGLAPGRYTIATRFPGLGPTQRSLLVSELNLSYDLGDILVARIQSLTGVAVTAEAVQTAAVNSEVYRIGEGAAATSGSILDALKNVPGVAIDQEGKVLLRGSDRVAVLIDGRPSSLTGLGSQRGLDNIPAANIEAVEIIHNPAARFDAAGMAGIINIVYKQERRTGLSGDAGLSLGMGTFSKQRDDLPTDLGSFSHNGKAIPSVNLNYNTGSARTFLFYQALIQRDLPNNEFTTRFYDDGRIIASQVPENRRQSQNIVRLGADFGVGSANVFSISGLYDTETHTDSAFVPFILQSTGQRERFWFWRERESNGIANAAFNWKHAFRTPGHELNLNFQYSRIWEDEAYHLNEVSSVRTGTDFTHVIAPENTFPLTLDYVRPLPSGRLELGGKLQRRWLPIRYEVQRGNQSVIYPGLGDFTEWDEDLVAGYANLVRVREAYTLEAGVRLEQTDVTYTVPDENIYYDTGDAYNYFEVFPNFKLNYLLGGQLRVIAAYNRRIDRPSEQELRIFPKYDDPELLKVGNPYLRPQLTQVMELGISRRWSKGSTTVSGYHRDITDAFQRIYAIDNSNPNYDVINKLYENVGRATQTGVQVVAEQQVSTPWRLSGSVNLYVHDIDAISTTLHFPYERPFFAPGSRDNTWDLTVNNRYRFTTGQELQLSYINYAARNAHQGRERARSSLDLSASWPLRNQRGDVTFTFTDMLADFGVRREFDGQGFNALYENLKETQTARVRMRVRF
jgi:hypothetical protein